VGAALRALLKSFVLRRRRSVAAGFVPLGASGVLLIQYRLLKCGIESAPMTTDAGIDLVVYSPKLEKAVNRPSEDMPAAKASWWNGKITA
jgi:hypothetical protein